MEFAHSFWSEPLAKSQFGNLKDKTTENLLFYATSVSWVHKMGHKITLYADAEGARFLSLIPYDDVVIVENTITDSTKFAASIKFIALEKMPLGDVLIDGDLYLWKPEIYKLLEESTEDVIVSAFEQAEEIECNSNPQLRSYYNNYGHLSGGTESEKMAYYSTLKQIKDSHPGMIEIFKKKFTQIADESYYSLDKELDGWHNTSLIRFNNAELRDKWIGQYKIYVERYKDVNFEGKWPDIIIEQRHLTDLCRNEGYTIKAVANDENTKIQNNYCWDIGFMHLGSAKREMIWRSFVYLFKNDNELAWKIVNAIASFTE